VYALTNESGEASEDNKVADHNYILLDCDMFRPGGYYH